MSDEKKEILLPTGEGLVLSSSPHIRTPESVRKIMYKVFFALLPASIAGIYFFGWRSLAVIAATVIFCVGAEALWCYLAKKPVAGTVSDGSAALTGLLLALNLPPQVPIYVCLIGAFLAIWLGKQVFGGLGHNPFNPALVARVGLLIALPAAMTTWVPAKDMGYYPCELGPNYYSRPFFNPADWDKMKTGEELDAVTCATPLGVAKATPKILDRSTAAKGNFSAIDNRHAWKQ